MSLKKLLRLYPRAWRDRYGDELAALLEETRPSWSVRVDLIRGAAREWLHELTSRRVLTSRRRIVLRVLSRVLVSGGLTLALFVLPPWLGATFRGLQVPWPIWIVALGLVVTMMARAARVSMRRMRAIADGRRPRSITYREFLGWVAGLSLVLIMAAAAGHSLRWTNAITIWMMLDWLYATTPRAVRHEWAERRLMRRPDFGLGLAAMAREQARRVATAERLIRFYGRVPPHE